MFRLAFRDSLPVLMGYGSMGFAAGLLLAVHGGISWSPVWAAVSSALFISGPLQFLFVDWVRTSLVLGSVLVVVLCINFRYCLYGLSLLERFAGCGRLGKFYLIMGITDETYALEMSRTFATPAETQRYCLCLTALDQLYWIAGVTAGALAGVLAQNLFSPARVQEVTQGIDFGMTALFLVILTDQCRQAGNRLPALLGGGAATLVFVALAAFLGMAQARADMLIPSIVLIVAALLGCRRVLEGGKA